MTADAGYMPILVTAVLAVGFAAVSLGASALLSRLTLRGHRHSLAADQPYECGMPVLTDARTRFSVKFYIVAMLFILFDVEVVFLYPWAVLYGRPAAERAALAERFGGDPALLGLLPLFLGLVAFTAVLMVGWLYVVRKGVLEWQTES